MTRATELARSFRMVLAQDSSGFVCRVPEFPGLIARGDTAAECEREGREALIALLASVIADGQEPPQPQHVHGKRTQVNFRVSAADLYVLETAAARAGQSVGEFTRTHAMEAARALLQ